jgi:hypothetical protein
MLGLLLILAAQGASTFAADLGQAVRDFIPARQKHELFLAQGDLEGAEQLWLACVPAEKRTAAHCFQLAEAFTLPDPPFARAQLARAYELAPDELQIAQAWATQLHRVGRLEEAESIYARVSAAGRDWYAGVQRVDCLVRLDRLEEAREAWRALRNAAALPKAFRFVAERISSGDTREHRRALLRRSVAQAAGEGAEELAFLEFERPGNQGPFELERRELDTDRSLIQAHLDPQSRRSRELWVVVDFWAALAERGFPPASVGDFAASFAERMRELGWLEAGGEVPRHPLVLRWATTALLESGLREHEELLADWERALSARLEEGDVGAGRALHELQRSADLEAASQTDELLWARAHELEAARALLERREERLEPGDPLLRSALERYPDDVRLRMLAAGAARRAGKGEREALRRTIAAGYQPPGSFECVRAAFERLEQLASEVEGR